MASMDQIRRSVFSHSIGYIGGVAPHIIEQLKNQVNSASSSKLDEVQNTINITNNDLIHLWNSMAQQNETHLQHNNLYTLALHLLLIFIHNNTKRNLNADMKGEGF